MSIAQGQREGGRRVELGVNVAEEQVGSEVKRSRKVLIDDVEKQLVIQVIQKFTDCSVLDECLQHVDVH